MGVNRLNPVQQTTYFLKKSKMGINEECTVTLRQLQTSHHRFRAISALISAASPVKWIGMLSYEPPRRQRISTSRVAHSAMTNIGRSIII